MANALKSVPDQNFTAQEWQRVVSFCMQQVALWQCEWLFSPVNAPDTNAKAESDGWEQLWNVFSKVLIEQVPSVAESLRQQKELVVVQRQIQRKLKLDQGSQIAAFKAGLLGGLARTLSRIGFSRAARFVMSRSLYPAGTMGRAGG
jgi:hypothetical protein